MADTAQPIPPPDERWIAEFQRHNKGASRAVALNEAALMASEQTGESAESHLTRWLSSPMTAVLNPVQAYSHVVAPSIQSGVDLLLRGGGAVPPNALSSGIASLVTPKTLTGAAITAAAPGVSKLRGFLPRLGAMTGIGAGAGTATTDDPIGGAIEGALAQMGGEFVRGAQYAKEGVSHIRRYATLLKDRVRDAESTLGGFFQAVPEFKAVPIRPGDAPGDLLYRISENADRLAGKAFGRADTMLTTALGGPRAEIPLPSQRFGPSPPPTMAVEDALQLLKERRASARKAPDGALGFATREAARELGNDIYAAAGRVSPALETMYREVTDHYAKSVRLAEGLIESGAFEGPIQRGKRATFDGGMFLRWLQENRQDVPYKRFQPVYDALLRGAKPGASDVIGVAPRIRGYFGGGISGTTPNIQFMREPRGGWGARTPSLLPPAGTMGTANVVSGYTVE